MRWPARDDVLFSLKSYAGAMMALYLSYRIGLPRPFWAVTTAYVVSQPWSGAVRSRAAFRLGGTFVGSALCVFIVPQLANAPLLMCLFLMAWIGLCVFVSVLDRTPRAYVFTLAGYTAAMIAFPSVLAPENVFDTALWRVEEIGLGIVCAALAHSLIFPRSIGSAIMAGLNGAIKDSRQWMTDVLAARATPVRRREQLKLASDMTQLRVLSTHIPFDTSNIRFNAQSVHGMQNTMAALAPVIASVEDRMLALTSDGRALPAAWQSIIDEFQVWLTLDERERVAASAPLAQAIERAMPALNKDTDWHEALLLSLGVRLSELITLYNDAQALRARVESGLAGQPQMPERLRAASDTLDRDYRLALLSGVAAAVAVGVCCAFWIATAWSNGATAALMAAIFSSLFAAQDNPVPGILMFFKYTVLSIPLPALYLLGILPALHSFEMVALVVFPVAFILGIFIARPATMLKGLAVLMGFFGTLALHDTQTADLVTFLDTIFAQLIGVATAAMIATLFRRVSVQASIRRIRATSWRELAQVATARRAPNASVFDARRLDRVGLLHSRLGASEQADDMVQAALLDLRMGRDVVDTMAYRDASPDARTELRALLAELSRLFRSRVQDARKGVIVDQPAAHTAAKDRAASGAQDTLLTRIDTALRSICARGQNDAVTRGAVVSLVGLRRALFPASTAYTGHANQASSAGGTVLKDDQETAPSATTSSKVAL